MADEAPDPRAFYEQLLPRQFDRALRSQERAVEAARRVLDGMRQAAATLCAQVGDETFYLNLEAGSLCVGAEPAHPPVLTMVQDPASFAALVRDAGDSPLGFLGAISGLSGELKLTRSRLDALAGLSGCVRFEVTGDAGYAILLHFGAGPLAAEPDTRIRIDPDVYGQLRRGEIDAQAAFLEGRIDLEGDMGLAMQIALAAMTPD